MHRYFPLTIQPAVMPVYKFRCYYEEDENIFRDIEIKTNQKLEHFQQALADAFKLKIKSDGSFSIANDNWQKLKTLKNLGKHELENLIFDPHQKFIYENEERADYSFLMEMMSIEDELKGEKYPRITKSAGPSPFRNDEMKKYRNRQPEDTEVYGLDSEDKSEVGEMGEEGEEGENLEAGADEEAMGDELEQFGDREEGGFME